MTEKMKQRFSNVWAVVRYFFIDLLGTESVRIQLIWFTAFSWATTHLWFGVVLPFVREVSIIYYRQNGIVALPISLDSPYAQSILNSTDMAFTGVVVAYVASRWSAYKVTGQAEATEKSDSVEEK